MDEQNRLKEEEQMQVAIRDNQTQSDLNLQLSALSDKYKNTKKKLKKERDHVEELNVKIKACGQ